jgi:hypothetical protein
LANLAVAMENDLTRKIQSAINGKEDCYFISDEQATQLTTDLSAKFSFDLTKLFIWTKKDLHNFYEYGDDREKWATTIRELLNRFDEDIFLCITNEEFYPWKIIKGRKPVIIDLLQELPCFEYFIFDATLQYVVFDTHENFFVDFIQSWIRI